MATLRDVAARAGVSISTVRCALYDLGPVREGTRQRVLDAARDLAYAPNPRARALVRGKAPMVALVVPQLLWHVSSVLVVTLQHRLAARGLHTALFLGDDADPGATVTGIRQLAAEAAVLVQVGWRDEYRRLPRHGIHLVGVDVRPQLPEDAAADGIRLDRIRAFRVVTEHLLGLGHRRIGLLASYGGVGRREGYEQALEAAGLPERAVAVVDADGVKAPGIRAGLEELLAVSPHLTAVVCSTDLWAQEAIRHLSSMGKRVPRDVSVTGYSNEPWTQWATPSLTTVDQGTRRLSDQTLELLGRRADGSGEPWSRRVIEPELVPRGSTAPPRAGASGGG